MFFVALLLLSVAAAASASLRSGGDVCTYHLVYRKYNDTLPPDGIPAFTGTLVLNATGYYATIREYRPFSDACGAGQLRERGLESFSFTHENVTYSTAAGSFAFDGPWFRHQPVGVKYADLRRNDVLDAYFPRFRFILDGFVLHVSCDDLPDTCVCDNAGSFFCISKVVPVDCNDNSIPFVPDTSVTISSDGTSSITGHNSYWFGIGSFEPAPGDDVYSPVLLAPSSPVLYMTGPGTFVDLTSPMCPGPASCYYLRQTMSGGGRATLRAPLYLGPGIGQAQRLRVQIAYWSLPISTGQLCVYFGYSRVDVDSPNIRFRPILNKIWCGGVEPHESGASVLDLALPLTYGPAYSGLTTEGYEAEGYASQYPLVIEAGSGVSVVIYNATFLSMGKGYCHVELGRREQQQDLGDHMEEWRNWHAPPSEEARH